MDGNERPATGGETERAREMTRYQVDVGEEFPLSEKEKNERACGFDAEWHARWHARDGRRHEGRDWHGGEWGGFRAPRLLVLLAVIAVGVALISTAASYPLATLGIAAAFLLFAGGHFRHHGHHRGHHRGGRHDRHRRHEGDAA